MSQGHQISFIIVAIFLIALIIYLVRKRMLREEYSWLWILTGLGLLILATSESLLNWLSKLIGTLPITALFLLAIFFLVAIVLQFSIRLSELTDQVRKLAQVLAIKQTDGDHLDRK
tara:strand:- start:71 stop:418 length:348 start_codon:yes stop_codon:yes gene_type:complete